MVDKAAARILTSDSRDSAGDSSKAPLPEVTLINNNNNLTWSVTVLAGTPQKEVSVLIDTGSSIFWVPSSTAKCQILTNGPSAPFEVLYSRITFF